MRHYLVKKLLRLPRLPFLALIELYQRTISPDHGIFKRFFPLGYCRFYPSCSTYGYQAVNKYGIIGGFWRVVWRILRCNPWSKGGVDELK